MKRKTLRICFHCKQPFEPNWRNRHRQRFCQNPDCRKASKLRSHQAWLKKNPEYFSQIKHAQRVRTWRDLKYAKQLMQRGGFEELLQEFVRSNPLVVGLVAQLFGCKSQDALAKALRLLINRGNEFLSTQHVDLPRKSDGNAKGRMNR